MRLRTEIKLKTHFDEHRRATFDLQNAQKTITTLQLENKELNNKNKLAEAQLGLNHDKIEKLGEQAKRDKEREKQLNRDVAI